MLVTGVFGVVIALMTQKWMEKRERRSRRDEMKLELYVEVIGLILLNEQALAEAGGEGQHPSLELQKNRVAVSHRLKLLASKPVQEAYCDYDARTFQESVYPVDQRSSNPSDVVKSREALIQAMAADIQFVR